MTSADDRRDRKDQSSYGKKVYRFKLCCSDSDLHQTHLTLLEWPSHSTLIV
jgi:hypothetical protein